MRVPGVLQMTESLLQRKQREKKREKDVEKKKQRDIYH
jgi:hypothetical protein